ncbi:MAG: ABC transporter permease subunit [Finegoldia sp.]|nr:ABC transporter permease subunit [Finegoldia sp.]
MNKKIIRILVSIFIFLPIFYMLVWAFIERWPFESVFPEKISFRAWKSLLSNPLNIKILFSSLAMSLLVAFLAVFLSYPASKALAFYDLKFKNLIRVLLFVPIILPVTSLAIGLHLNFLRLGIANKFWGVVLVHIFPCIPYCIMSLEPVFSSVGQEYENQATLLGAKGIKKFLYVNLPLALPGIKTAFFMSFIVSFSQYFLTFLIGGGLVRTYATIMFPILSNKDRHEAAVFSLVFLIVCLIVEKITFSFGKKFDVEDYA